MMDQTTQLGEPRDLTYSFDDREGQLWMTAGNNCDMVTCVQLFTQIDPDVQTIYTYSGPDSDTAYFRDDDGQWFAFRMTLVEAR